MQDLTPTERLAWLSAYTGYNPITVVEHPQHDIEVYTLDNGRIAHRERWQDTDGRGFLTNATSTLYADPIDGFDLWCIS